MAKNYFGITDTGKMRTNNEDTFIAETVIERTVILLLVLLMVLEDMKVAK